MYAFLPFPHSRVLMCIRDARTVHDGASLAPTSYLASSYYRGRYSPPRLCDVCVFILIWLYMLYLPLRTSSSGMVYKDAEKLYAEVRADTEAVVDNALCVLYPGSVPLSSAATAPASGPLTVFAHNTTPFPRRDIVRIPLAESRIGSGNVLQTTSDGKEGYVVLEGSAGGGLVLPSQISAKDLGGAQIFVAFFSVVIVISCS